jgi:predicted neutral ceramidase superfamily lipid hydrolase
LLKREDVLEEYIKKEEARGHPYWAIKRALKREGIKDEKVRKAMGRRKFKRKAYKNLVFLSQIIIWLLLVLIVAISSEESILLIAAAFSPIFLNYLASFYVVNNLKEKFLLFIIPFITTAVVFITFALVMNERLSQMDVANLTFLNIAIGLVFNIFVYFVNDYKNVNVPPPQDKEKAEKIINNVLRESYKDIEALRREFSNVRVSQRQILHDLAEIKAEEQPEIYKQKMVVSTLHGKRYHKPSCIVVSKANSDDILHFKNRQDAVSKGYRPCKVCMPDDD